LHARLAFPKCRIPIAWADCAGVVWHGTEIAVLTGTDTAVYSGERQHSQPVPGHLGLGWVARVR
jgi:hypothetical protein